MRMVVCSVYDKKVAAYNTPIFVRTRGEAMRSFVAACRSDSVNRQKNFTDYPEDYVLMYLGYFDDESGQMTCAQSPEPVISALEAVAYHDRARELEGQ